MSRTVEVATRPPYDVRVGTGVLAEAPAALEGRSAVAVVTDERVAPLHLASLGLDVPHLVLPPGEATKSFAGLERVLEFLAGSGLDRRSAVVALGGGVVGDLAGLAASLFMRGIACLQAPTTLLAMVDSSVGGKTAIDLRAGKNLAGTFHQPFRVLADVGTLTTLPGEELASGLGEVVKSALVGDAELLALLEERAEDVLAREPALLEEVVVRCVRVKAAVVAGDEREAGGRQVLNLGHTFAHGIEHAAGYGRVPHGVAVAAGLSLALAASARLDRLEDGELLGRVAALLARLGLPRDLDDIRARTGLALPPSDLVRGMRHDKKGAAGRPRFVLVRSIGSLALGQEVPAGVLEELVASR